MTGHCWHFQGWASVLAISTDLRAGRVEVCCFCGARRTQRWHRPPGHGQYLPAGERGEEYHEYDPGVVPDVCPGRPR